MTKHEQSKQLWDQSKQYLSGGVASTLRASMKPVPLFAASGHGPRVKDVDGNSYIDYLLAYGPLILGHTHPEWNRQMKASFKNGVTYGLQHVGEMKLAQKLTEILPCAEKVAISGSGTEAVMLALRLARKYTGRTKVIRFHGHYHGWSDTIFTAFPSSDMQKQNSAADHLSASPGTGGQSKKALEEIILLPWNDEAALNEAMEQHGKDVAAVISEPVMCNSGCIMPKPGYLEAIRRITEQHGSMMILDEVITGFRLGLGGAHGRFGINPDMVTIGKALGGGIAISAVAGRSSVMDLIERGEVSHLGTLNGNLIATTAALAVLDILGKDQGTAFKEMEAQTTVLVEGLRNAMKQQGLNGLINQVGPVFHMMFTDETKVEDFAAFERRHAGRYAEFAERMIQEGVLVRPNGLWYISAVHGTKEVEETLSAATKVLKAMAVGN